MAVPAAAHSRHLQVSTHTGEGVFHIDDAWNNTAEELFRGCSIRWPIPTLPLRPLPFPAMPPPPCLSNLPTLCHALLTLPQV